MIYLDTSIVLPIFIDEPASNAIRGWFATLPPQELTISEWTRTEFASAVGIYLRSRRIDEGVARDVLERFHQLADQSLLVLIPERTDFSLASRFLQRFELGLRAGDALHLAIASNNGAHKLYSLDQVLIKSARALNIKSQMPV
jgi:predicted nucleic acid-binding protein